MQRSWADIFWDTICIASIIGIWPRFIEPQLLFVARHTVAIADLPQALDGMKILHFSDLHFCRYSSPSFIRRLQRKISSLSPDLILFSGDLLSYSQFNQKELAEELFSNISAPMGLFACLGNHDYNHYATLSPSGKISYGHSEEHTVVQGLRKIFGQPAVSGTTDEKVILTPNKELVEFYRAHHVTLLHNETTQVGPTGQSLNITGLGDTMANDCRPTDAFKKWNIQSPGIILAHNPEIFANIQNLPGDLYLFGHTHGGQVNIPFIRGQLLGTKHELHSGFYQKFDKTIFVSRGLGAPFPFRFLTPPNIALLTLVKGGKARGRTPNRQLFSLPQEIPTLATSKTSSLP